MRQTTDKQFRDYCRQRVDELLGLGESKGSEYATDNDRLANFRHGAALRRTIPEDYLFGLVAKHIVATQDFIERLKAGVMVSRAQWLEKTGDIIVYSLLLEGLLDEHWREPVPSREERVAQLEREIQEHLAEDEVGCSGAYGPPINAKAPYVFGTFSLNSGRWFADQKTSYSTQAQYDHMVATGQICPDCLKMPSRCTCKSQCQGCGGHSGAHHDACEEALAESQTFFGPR